MEKNIEAQIAASHKAICNAIEHHNSQGEGIDKKTSNKISKEIKSHAHKIAALETHLGKNK